MNILEGIDGQLLAVGAVFLLVLFVIVWAGVGVTRAREEMTDRLAVYGRTTTAVPTARDEELAKPLAQRTVGPVILRVGNFLKRFTPAPTCPAAQAHPQRTPDPELPGCFSWPIPLRGPILGTRRISS